MRGVPVNALHDPPTLVWERLLLDRGHRTIAGVDEVGRGSWAGPVVAAAVVLPLHEPSVLHALRHVRDSKQLTATERDRLAGEVRHVATAIGVGWASHRAVDDLGIAEANRLAMERAVVALGRQADALLIDYVRVPRLSVPQACIPRGDSESLSIAAASIIAKVFRDGWMLQLDPAFPQYGFARHKGYGTPEHRLALSEHGPCSVHRRSFRPVSAWPA